MEIFTPELLAQLGFSGVFLVFIIMLWQKLGEKDKKIETYTQKMQDRFDENTRVIEGMKYSLDKNTEIMGRVLDNIK